MSNYVLEGFDHEMEKVAAFGMRDMSRTSGYMVNRFSKYPRKFQETAMSIFKKKGGKVTPELADQVHAIWLKGKNRL